MRQKVVWFILGVLIGSLFVVSAYPGSSNVQYSVPAVQKISGDNYTTYLLYSRDGRPLDVQDIRKAVEKFVVESAPRAKWHVYAVPNVPQDFSFYGYGIKVAEDGRVDVYIVLSKSEHPIPPKKIEDKLLNWTAKKPNFGKDIPLKEKIGIPANWNVKSMDSTGEISIYSTEIESSPYWHNFGPVTIEVNDPPYGNIMAKTCIYGLWDDNDPNREYFLVAPDPSRIDNKYMIEPGYGLRENYGDTNYGYYVTSSAKIYHNWNLDSSLNPNLEGIAPTETLGGHSTTQVTIGYPPSITFTVTIPDSKMVADADSYLEGAVWTLTFNTDSDDAKHTFSTNVASEGSVSESVLHDGQWHAIVKIQFQATFQQLGDYLGWWGEHTTQGWVTWYVKVG